MIGTTHKFMMMMMMIIIIIMRRRRRRENIIDVDDDRVDTCERRNMVVLERRRVQVPRATLYGNADLARERRGDRLSGW